MRKIRVLFLPPVDVSNTNAQSLNTREIALRLDRQRFEVILFYCSDPDPRLRNQAHIRLQRLPARIKTWKLLREMCSGYDQIAYMDYSPASYLFVHLPRILRRRTKTILHVESTGLKLEYAARPLSFLYHGVVPNCDAYTGITDCVARELALYLNRPIEYVLPVGVDLGSFMPPLEHDGATPSVLFVGTLTPRKRPLYVLEAAERFPDAGFRLIGPGRDGYEAVVSDRISELGLRNVRLEGPKSQGEIAQAMRESDVFLFPSATEGLPKVTLEAAASGLPCIVFRDYQTPSVVDGLTGFQVSTPEEMIDKLGLLLDDPALRTRMGRAARQHAERFSWNTVSRRWEQAYLDIADRGETRLQESRNADHGPYSTSGR
jgi:glycosyltransferase involved in cell wall biosynthesis